MNRIKSSQQASSRSHAISRVRQQVSKAMRDPDRWVIRITYRDADGVVTDRRVSPTRWKNDYLFRALCTGRGDHRQFDIRRIESIKLDNAADVLMHEGVIKK
ncbi:hypothetical protein RMSM_02547 [Rhodopirellula maiorica SM1]|uniref:WYL domain-containing protein n=1 Tax=Rhodopirellula maiorica SM1 TaxID=1265738 RepID=M5RMI3_9BACT|nr:hypothetical protein [Rhodopirellula maiorica]EMI20515.1 hypothetical protein RMSM_02547 [Rhodopirellula maiorica SM1]